MTEKNKIGVLLLAEEDDSQLGVIEFMPEGLLKYQMIKPGLHVYVLRSVDRYLNENGFSMPLYEKYAEQMAENQTLSAEILWKEAEACTEAINKKPLYIGKWRAKAKTVRYS